MKKFFLLIACLCLFIGTIFVLIFLPHHPSATINHHSFVIEIAKTQKDQEIGLSKYTTLPESRAMYFPFPKSDYYTFWMKGMHFPIDIIFIQKGRIVTIYSSVPYPSPNQTMLPTYAATNPADSVLEINAGLSQKYGFHIGDPVIIDK